MEGHKSGQNPIEALESEQEALRKIIEGLKNERALLEWHIEYLEEQHGIDSLTGAKNRKTFERELEQSLKMIRREIAEHRAGGEALKEVSLIFIDIDHFKKINDVYGHSVGDEVLQKISALLMDSVRGTDIVARVGGEEFIVLLRDADVGIATRNAEDFRAKIARMAFNKTPNLNVTASFGVISSKSSTNAKTLYDLVDKALYAAKRAGRNRVEVYE